MSDHRRTFLKKLLAVSAAYWTAGCSLSVSAATPELPDKPLTPTILEDTLKTLFNDKKITDSSQIDLKIPKIAENGAVVPITVNTTLDDVLSISILVEKNPVPLAAKFELVPELEPTVSARIKMATSSDVIVMVETGEAFYRTRQHVNVTIGGCGD